MHGQAGDSARRRASHVAQVWFDLDGDELVFTIGYEVNINIAPVVCSEEGLDDYRVLIEQLADGISTQVRA